jgi:regulator of protease activity HflC (stomatin/prohibitin superfamily)
MQREVVKAEQGVMISERTADAVVKKQRGDSDAIKIAAEADAQATELRAKAESTRIALTGQAESEKILAIGKANAESYELAVKAMGKENFTSYKITEEIGKSGIQLMPQVLIGGSGEGGVNGTMNGLLAYEMLNTVKKSIQSTAEIVTPTTEPKKDEKKK